MKRNVCGIDKIRRFILGIAAILVGIFAPTTLVCRTPHAKT